MKIKINDQGAAYIHTGYDGWWDRNDFSYHLNFKCQHDKVEVKREPSERFGYDLDIYCPDCKNKDLTDKQFEMYFEDYIDNTVGE